MPLTCDAYLFGATSPKPPPWIASDERALSSRLVQHVALLLRTESAIEEATSERSPGFCKSREGQNDDGINGRLGRSGERNDDDNLALGLNTSLGR